MNWNKVRIPIAGMLLLFLAWITIPAFTQTSTQVEANPNARPIPIDRGTVELWRSLRELHTRASLIQFTAHPDDEDGGMLAYESRCVGADTTLFTLTRGEGGQNVMSSDFWDQLGILRTQELLAADRYYGVHQYWGRVADFGFTKTKEEALQKWGYDRLLYDSVRVVRMTRPLVVTSVFAANVSDGHGQHQVAGQMAQEVYKAAADPNMFPDQIRAGLLPWTPLKMYGGLLPWTPLKMYVRQPFARVTPRGVFDYATGHWAPARFHNFIKNTWIEGKPSATLQIPEGQYDPALGLSYRQVARRGWGEQKSQNGGFGIPPAGPAFTGYHLYASRVVTAPTETSFFNGIDVSLMGIAGYAPASQRGWIRDRLTSINALVEQAMHNFSIEAPEEIAPDLAQGLLQTEALIQEIQQKPLPPDARYNMLHELNTKRIQFNTALAQSLGLSAEAVVSSDASPSEIGHFGGSSDSFQSAIPGQSFGVQIHVANQGKDPVAIQDVRLLTTPDKDWTLHRNGPAPTALTGNEAENIDFRVTVPEDATITRPYFTRPSLEQPYYDLLNPAYANLSNMPYPLSAQVTFAYRGARIVLNQVVQTVHHVTGPGPVMDPLIVSPAISIWVSPRAGIVPLTSKSLEISALIHSNVKGPASGTVTLQMPPGWASVPALGHFAIREDGDEQNIQFRILPKRLDAREYKITVSADYEGHAYSSGSTRVGYVGLRPYPYYRDASYRTTGVDVHLAPHLAVGYITGSGDDVPSSLEDLGIHVHFLTPEEIATGDLDRFNAIVLGVRAYAVRPELKTYNARLLQYVHDGGSLIVQYNTPEYDHDYGPYPYRLGNNPEKVVDETSKVELLQPDNPALTWPNKITAHDFDGWVEERGHGFMSTWDPRYIALTETHDPDQSPQKGGLLVAPYGKGFYVYDAYALYRQLPEGVPGAFRIFANLLSLSSNPGMRKLSTAGTK